MTHLWLKSRMESPYITPLRLLGRLEILYRLGTEYGFSVFPVGEQHADVLSGDAMAYICVVASKTRPGLSFEIVVQGASTKNPFYLGACDPDISRQENEERERIEKLIDALNAQDRTSEAMPAQATDATSEAQCVFEKKGNAWEITHRAKSFIIQETKGLAYIIILLKNPTKDFSCLELVQLVSGNGTTGEVYKHTGDLRENELYESEIDGDAENVLDPKAEQEYWEKIQELTEQMKTATDAGEYEKAEKLEAEKDRICQELRSATGLGGKSRRFNTPIEKARRAVFDVIKNARSKIKAQDDALGDYLETTIVTGRDCVYRPDKASKPMDIRFVSD